MSPSEDTDRQVYGFVEAMAHLRAGGSVGRLGWCGAGSFIHFQYDNGVAHLYLDTREMTNRPAGMPWGHVPYEITGEDIRADDWVVVAFG